MGRSDISSLARLVGTEQYAVCSEQWVADTVAEFTAQMSELSLDGVPRTSHPQRLSNVFREDEPRPSLTAEEVLRSAPETELNRFKVPRILMEEQ